MSDEDTFVRWATCSFFIIFFIAPCFLIYLFYLLEDITSRIIYVFVIISIFVSWVLTIFYFDVKNIKMVQIGFFLGIISCVSIIMLCIYGSSLFQRYIEKISSSLLIGYNIWRSLPNQFEEFFISIGWLVGLPPKDYYTAYDLIPINEFWAVFISILDTFIYLTAISSIKYQIEALNSDTGMFAALAEGNTKLRISLGRGFLTPTAPLICSYCDFQNPPNSKICKNCHNEFLKCKICNKRISKDDKVLCPYCNASYHKKEFLEWLKVKAHCINCNKEMDLWEFQKFLMGTHELKEISSKLCPNCKKLVPNDSIFCINCGVRV